jgi:uncharacterized protein
LKILIDIAHPAHIHYFKNFASIFSKRGNYVVFTLRNKGIILDLANYYKLNYKIRSSENKSTMIYSYKSMKNIYAIAKQYNPDLYLDMGTVFASPIAKTFKKPYIAFDDTEPSYKSRLLHMPFTDVIITPMCFKLELNPQKHIRINGFMELFYLHPLYFTPNPGIYQYLNINSGEKYVLFRFVSFEAHHDKRKKGVTLENKIKAVKEISKYANVFISSETFLPRELEEYRFSPPPHLMHDAIAYSSLLFGESATMASEASMLGIPSIFIDKYTLGYTDYLENKYGLLYNYTDSESDQKQAIKRAIEVVTSDSKKYLEKQKKLLSDSIDMNKFLLWFIEYYPESFKIMKENPEYQYKFK